MISHIDHLVLTAREGHAKEANFDELWVLQAECLRSRPHLRTEGAGPHAGRPECEAVGSLVDRIAQAQSMKNPQITSNL